MVLITQRRNGLAMPSELLLRYCAKYWFVMVLLLAGLIAKSVYRTGGGGVPQSILEGLSNTEVVQVDGARELGGAELSNNAALKSNGIASHTEEGTEPNADQKQAAIEPPAQQESKPLADDYPIADSDLFTPNQFRAGNHDRYVNRPVYPETAESRSAVEKALSRPIDEPYGLRHKASPPGNDAVMGLAAYPRNMLTWVRLVGSLRRAGYDGHIIFGVHKDIPQREEEYLKAMDVTYYEVDMVECYESIRNDAGGGNIRGKCAKGLETLTLEWGRFEMCRQWLKACEECTGWTLVMDTRDVFFQAHPFASLPAAEEAEADLLFIEEIGSHTSPKPEKHRWYDLGNNGRYKGRTEPCYGKGHWKEYADRPVLCSGTIVGTRDGMIRFLSVFVDEFYSNNEKSNVRCKSPHNTDQWTMNYLYYTGKFGEYSKTKTMPWGTGPVFTIGHPCINTELGEPNHSQKDMIEFDDEGYILNNHEKDGSKARMAPVVHQYDRCHIWINSFFRKQKKLFNDSIVKLPWKQEKETA